MNKIEKQIYEHALNCDYEIKKTKESVKDFVVFLLELNGYDELMEMEKEFVNYYNLEV